MRTLVTVMSAALLVAMTAGVTNASSTAVKPSWKCISGVCLGTTVAAMNYRYGAGWAESSGDGVVGGEIKVSDGHVYATNTGDLCRATKRITRISTSDPIVRLPDGVQMGTKIPFGRTRRGYTYFTHGDFNSAWRKRVVVNRVRVEVMLFMTRGRVTSVGLNLGWNLRCGS